MEFTTGAGTETAVDVATGMDVAEGLPVGVCVGAAGKGVAVKVTVGVIAPGTVGVQGTEVTVGVTDIKS